MLSRLTNVQPVEFQKRSLCREVCKKVGKCHGWAEILPVAVVPIYPPFQHILLKSMNFFCIVVDQG